MSKESAGCGEAILYLIVTIVLILIAGIYWLITGEDLGS